MKTKIILSVVALAVISGGLYFVGSENQSNLGGLSERDVQAVSLKLGPKGNKITKEIATTCNAATSQLPLEATSTDDFTCTVTGAEAGDNVSVTLPSNSGSVYGGFAIGHAVASTDTVTFGIVNLTGAATSSFPLATTTVMVRVLDN